MKTSIALCVLLASLCYGKNIPIEATCASVEYDLGEVEFNHYVNNEMKAEVCSQRIFNYNTTGRVPLKFLGGEYNYETHMNPCTVVCRYDPSRETVISMNAIIEVQNSQKELETPYTLNEYKALTIQKLNVPENTICGPDHLCNANGCCVKIESQPVEEHKEPEQPVEEHKEPEQPVEEHKEPEQPVEEHKEPEQPSVHEPEEPKEPHQEQPAENPEQPAEEHKEPEQPVEEHKEPEQPAEHQEPEEPKQPHEEQPAENPEEHKEPEQPVEEHKEPETPVEEHKEPEQPAEEHKEPEQPSEHQEPEEPKQPHEEQPAENPEEHKEPEQPAEEHKEPEEPQQPHQEEPKEPEPEPEREYPCSEAGVFEDDADQGSFFLCYLKSAHIKCAAGTVFNKAKGHCEVPAPSNDYEQHIKCSQEGFFRNPYDCNRFYRCYYNDEAERHSGQMHIAFFMCRDDMVFDNQAQTCVVPAATSEVCANKELTHEPEQPEVKAPEFEKYLKCSQDGYFRNPYDCHLFYRCYHNDPTETEYHFAQFYCANGQVFDEVSKSCVESERTAECQNERLPVEEHYRNTGV